MRGRFRNETINLLSWSWANVERRWTDWRIGKCERGVVSTTRGKYIQMKLIPESVSFFTIERPPRESCNWNLRYECQCGSKNACCWILKQITKKSMWYSELRSKNSKNDATDSTGLELIIKFLSCLIRGQNETSNVSFSTIFLKSYSKETNLTYARQDIRRKYKARSETTPENSISLKNSKFCRLISFVFRRICSIAFAIIQLDLMNFSKLISNQLILRVAR